MERGFKMKTRKLIKAVRLLKKCCISYGDLSCGDCIFRNLEYSGECILKNSPYKYDIEKIQENAQK